MVAVQKNTELHIISLIQVHYMQVSQTGCTEISTSGLKVTCKSNKNQDPFRISYHLCSACHLASSGIHTQRSEFCGAGRCTNIAETRSLSPNPSKRVREDAGSCTGRWQGNRQTLLRPAGRDLGTSRCPPHGSLATGTPGLPPHLTDHSDLCGSKYIFNLSHSSRTS